MTRTCATGGDPKRRREDRRRSNGAESGRPEPRSTPKVPPTRRWALSACTQKAPVMPDPFTPPMSGALLSLLDDLRPGDWLALASANAPMLERTRSLTVDASLEDVAAAVFHILPISRDTRQPLAGWAVDDRDPRFTDLSFAVQGLASDGSGRRQAIYALPDDVLVECAADGVMSTVRVPWDGAQFLFLVCVGGARHEPTDLRRRRTLAGVC